jgi:membrane-associated protein
MADLIAGVLDGLAGLNTTALYLLAGLFTALETPVGIGLLVPGDVLLAGVTATTPHRYAALVTTTVLGSLAGESVGYLLGHRYGLRLRTGRLGRRSCGDRRGRRRVLAAARRPGRPGRPGRGCRRARGRAGRASRPVPRPASSPRPPAEQPSPTP